MQLRIYRTMRQKILDKLVGGDIVQDSFAVGGNDSSEVYGCEGDPWLAAVPSHRLIRNPDASANAVIYFFWAVVHVIA